MANNYKVKVQVEIVECPDAVTAAPSQEGVGTFAYIIPADQAHSIDACEQALLQTTYPTLRETLATHLSEIAKKKPKPTDTRAR